MSPTPVIVVQGGAGTYSRIIKNDDDRTTNESAIADSARSGYKVLKGGGSALDAVEAAVVSMEECPLFNADHVLMVGEGAKKFAENEGVELVSTEYLATEKTKARLKNEPKFLPYVNKEIYEQNRQSLSERVGHDTVGAVAVDTDGNVAYATSSGGIHGRMFGRAGDSAIFGSGGYAENSIGAVSTTGHGESFMKLCLAKEVMFLMQQGKSPREAIRERLEYMEQKVGGTGGCIAIDHHGNIGIYFTTEGMSWASVKDDELRCGIFAGEDKCLAL